MGYGLAGSRPSLSRPLAIYGVITSPLVILLIFAGHIRLDVHGMTAVLLTEVIWFAGMGVKLMRAPDRAAQHPLQ